MNNRQNLSECTDCKNFVWSESLGKYICKYRIDDKDSVCKQFERMV